MITYAAYLFVSGFALFLLGFSVFMYFENRKFGDNQFTVKLLPPPQRTAGDSPEAGSKSYRIPGLELAERPARAFSESR